LNAIVSTTTSVSSFFLAMIHSLYRRTVGIEAWRNPRKNRQYKHLPILRNLEVAEANPSGKWWPARRNIYSKNNRGIKSSLSV